MALDIFIWWLVIQLLGLLALPLAGFLFPYLPDRGYAFSKPLGLLLTGYLAWLLAMLGLGGFSRGLLVFCALVVGVVGLLVTRGGLATLGGALRAQWRRILGYEALFLAALLFLALIRTLNPAPWGTERPMDFAFFNAIQRSDSFPPHDPWMAGYSINYYYFGYLLMAAMAQLTGLEPAVAFNLSLALIFALTALGVAGLVVNTIGLSEHRIPRAALRSSSSVLRLCAVLLSVVLVLFAANQGGTLQLISGTPMILALDGSDMARALQNGLGPRAPLTLDPPFKGWDFDGTQVITPTDTWENFNWWNPSRALWDSYPDPVAPGRRTRAYTITEFPFFSFWLGDMHPHVMALPFGLLALALALQTLARPAAPAYTQGRRGWLQLGLTGVALGSLYTINSWDFPTYLLLFLGALLLLYVRLGRQQAVGAREQGIGDREPEPATQPAVVGRPSSVVGLIAQPLPSKPGTLLQGIWWQHFFINAVAVVVASLALFAPFYMTFRSLVGAKDPLVNLLLLGGLTRTVGFVTAGRTPLHTFLIIFGLFLVPLLAFVFGQSRRIPAPRTVLWVALGALVLGLVAGFPLLFLLPLAVYAIGLAARAEQPGEVFALWAFALVCLVCFGTEVVYIRDVFEGGSSRMNTIFKFYYQAWLIWGMLAGYAVWWLARPSVEPRRPLWIGTSALVGLLFVALLAGALAYPWLTAGRAFQKPLNLSLEGKTPRQNTPAGAASVAWLRANARRDAVLLEAVGDNSGDNYDRLGIGLGGVSAGTGLASVMGWPGHERQWRGGDQAVYAQIEPRWNDVNAIYTGTLDLDAARKLLDTYHVDYIYVGRAERERYPADGLSKLAQLGQPVFQQDEVVIYQVKR